MHQMTEAEAELEFGLFLRGTREPLRVIGRGRDRVRFVL